MAFLQGIAPGWSPINIVRRSVVVESVIVAQATLISRMLATAGRYNSDFVRKFNLVDHCNIRLLFYNDRTRP